MQLIAVDYHASDAAQQFTESLRNTGFGVLKNHPIAEAQVSAIYRHWESFFNDDDKYHFLYDRATQDGFFPSSVSETAKGHTQRDLKEYFHYYPWGRCPAHLQDELARYYADATKLATELLQWVEHYSSEEVAAGYAEPLSKMISNSDKTLLRVLHYPPFQGTEPAGAIRAAAHEDINLLTVLPAANEPGLQVKAKNGKWLDVPCDFGNLIVNIGDMLQEASGGYYPSTTHRVINPTGGKQSRGRISLPLFLHPRPDVVLSSRHTADSYLTERLRELGVL